MGKLLNIRLLTALLALTTLFTAEEFLHLFRSHPNDLNWHRTALDHAGCLDIEANGRLIQCPVRGYGTALFICIKTFCGGQNPSNGRYVSPAELRMLEVVQQSESSDDRTTP